jgi:lipoprotein-releasing system permease protein
VPFELIVALRYLREGSGQTGLILTGVGVGVGVIIFLSALIGGLQDSLVDRTLGTQAHIIVRPREDMPRVLPVGEDVVQEARVERPAQRVRSIVQWQRAQDDIAAIPGVTATAPTISGPGIAARGDGASSVAVRGFDAAGYRGIVDLEQFLVDGELRMGSFEAAIGVGLAQDLGLSVGDRFRLRAGTESADVGGVAYTVTGIFDIGNKDLNSRWVLVSLRAAQTLFGLEGGVSTIEVKGADIYDAERLAVAIAGRTGLEAESWMSANAQLLTALRSQSSSSMMIQVFVILAVALGIASVLAVSVVQKSREIGILRATGTTRQQILRIFLSQGAIVGFLGSAIGIALGVGLGALFASLATNPDGTPTFPLILDPMLYLRSAAIAIAVGLSSAIIPALRAARMDPAQAIRSG